MLLSCRRCRKLKGHRRISPAFAKGEHSMSRLTPWPNDSPRATGRVIGAGAGPDYAESHPESAEDGEPVLVCQTISGRPFSVAVERRRRASDKPDVLHDGFTGRAQGSQSPTCLARSVFCVRCYFLFTHHISDSNLNPLHAHLSYHSTSVS